LWLAWWWFVFVRFCCGKECCFFLNTNAWCLTFCGSAETRNWASSQRDGLGALMYYPGKIEKFPAKLGTNGQPGNKRSMARSIMMTDDTSNLLLWLLYFYDLT
jgi:hypothetical protein